MLVEAPHKSAFTFHSAVHSAHVLHCLNDQRLHDVLCDVTVVVGNKSFRAHRSVLASCSVYFHSEVTSITSPNPIIALPDEVSVEGFEPLLQFAYTSKLPFTKENIHAIHRSAELLGFHNLESACFDFVMPKFSEGKQMSQETGCSSCSRSQDPGDGVCSGLQKNQPETLESQRGDDQTDIASHSPQRAQAETCSREEGLCLENCGPQMAPLSLDLSTSDVCPMLSLPCPDSDKADHPPQFCERDILEIGVCNQSELTLAGCDLHCELSTPGSVTPPEVTESAAGNVAAADEMQAAEASCDPGSCPLVASGAGDCGELEQSEVGLERRVAGDLAGPTLNVQSYEEGLRGRSSVEREVAEHMANILGFWSNLSQPQPLPLDHMEQTQPPITSDFHCLKQLDLSSSVGDCPFLQGLETGNDLAPLSDTMSQSEKSPYMSSSLNSGDESDLDTDGDTEANNRRAAEIQLPFPVGQISTLTRSAFQQLLRKNHLNQVQLEFVHDVRRRSKNRVAAQRCRKRKLEGIHHLECEIKRLSNEKERLLQEQSQLEQSLEETRQSLCQLCKTVKVDSDQDYLQILTKLSSEPATASPYLAGKHKESQMETLDVSQQPEHSVSAPLPDLSPQHDNENEQLLQEQSQLEETRQNLCRLCKTVKVESDQDYLQFLTKLSSEPATASPCLADNENERLLQEQSQLEQNLEETRQNLCRLCKTVKVESDQDYLQILTKLSSEPATASPYLAGKHRESQMETLDVSQQPEHSVNAPLPDLSPQHGDTDPVSLADTCLGTNN